MVDGEKEQMGAPAEAEQALVSDQAATRLDPSGFDPSRGDVVLRKEVFDFLMGEAAYDGTWFGELNDALPGRFWWRSILRAAQRETASGMRLRENSRSEVEAAGPQPDPEGETPNPQQGNNQ